MLYNNNNNEIVNNLHHMISTSPIDNDYDNEFNILVDTYMVNIFYITTAQGIFSYMNSLFGAGFVTLPYCYEKLGLIFGTLSILILAMITNYTCQILIKLSEDHRVPSYESLGELAYGKIGFSIVSIFQILFCFGSICAYISVFGHILSPIVSNWNTSFFDTHEFLCFIATFIVYPFSITNAPTSITNASLLSCIITFLVVITVISYVTYDNKLNTFNDHLMADDENIFEGLSILIFSFICQHRSFMIYRSLRMRDSKKWKKVSNRTLITVSLIYIIFGSFGYLGLPHTNINFFEDYKESSILIHSTRCAIAICIVMSLPLEMMVLRSSLRRLFKKISPLKYQKCKSIDFFTWKYFCLNKCNNNNIQNNTNLNSTSEPFLENNNNNNDINNIEENNIEENNIEENKINNIARNSSIDNISNDSDNDPLKLATRQSSLSNYIEDPSLNRKRRILTTTIILIFAYLINLGSTNLGKILAPTGVIPGLGLAFILPAIFYFKLGLSDDFSALAINIGNKSFIPNKIYLTIIFLIGFCFLIFFIIAVILSF